jgi:molecular chaperone GrpE
MTNKKQNKETENIETEELQANRTKEYQTNKTEDPQTNKNEELQTKQSTDSVNNEIDYKDKYVRLLAEFSNFSRQKEDEIKSIVKFANKNILLKIIDVIDDIDAGLQESNTTEETKSILNMVKTKLSQILLFEGVEEIKINKGDDFDATNSEVIQTIDDKENSGKIVEVLRKGYIMSDKVLRTAKVIVGK